ncbi:hypothetical protein GCM10009789_36620 [Kribbella sancticallisti]|uniref:UbiC transcription regulator-associated domain-containing protein n=1 Tax=Kribbella sancticallisti TaxID=460087 RepID=A0ABP4PHU3_9ACTN
MPPRHRLIAELIRRSIARGELGAAGAVLSLAELAERFGSSEDVRLALVRLQSDGLIVLQGERGAVVSESPMLAQFMSTPAGSAKPELTRDETFLDEAQRLGLAAANRSETRIEQASLEVADQLEIAVRTPIVHRQVVRCANDGPVALEHAYYPYDVMPSADPAVDARTLLEAAGYRRVGWIDTVVARQASREEASALALDARSPLLDHGRVLYSRNGDHVRPVAYVRTLFVASRHRLIYDHKYKG